MKTRYLILVAIMAYAALLRIYQITSYPPGLYSDEAMNGSNVLEVLETGQIRLFYPENNGREGLYINGAIPFVYWFGNKAWALRIPAILFGLATVWGMYLLGTELFGSGIGLLAAFLVATSFWHINFSRVAFRAIASPCMLTWALWTLCAGFRRLDAGRTWRLLFLISGVVYGLGFYTYISYRVTPVLIVGVLTHFGYRLRNDGRMRTFAAATLLLLIPAVLIVIPLLIYFGSHPGSFFGRVSQVAVWRGPRPYREVFLNIWRTGRMFFRRGDLNWRHNFAYRSEMYWPVSIFFAVGVGYSVTEACRKRVRGPQDAEDLKWFGCLLLLGWLLVSGIPVVLSNELVPHALRALLMIPPAFLLAAVGAWETYRWLALRSPAVAPMLLAGTLMLVAFNGYKSYFKDWALNSNVPKAFNAPLVEIARKINALPKETAKYVVVFPAGVFVHGVPMPAQPVMFLTRSYTSRQQEETNIRYIVPDSQNEFDAYCARVQEKNPGGIVFCLKCEAPQCFP